MMNKQKIQILLLTVSFLINTNAAFSDSPQNTSNPKPPSQKLQASAEDTKSQYINKDWWDKFHDPILKVYILKAIKDNYDLKIATLKVEEANATVQEYFGKEFPGINVGLNYLTNRTSGNIISSPSSTQNTYIFPLNVNYELDLWRKNREATIGKEKELESIKYEEKAAYISLCSTISTVYFNIINTDRQLQIQKDIIDLRKSILEMTKENNKQGLSPTTDVIQADRALTEAQSGLNDLKKQQSILLNELAVLTGDSSDNSASLKRTAIDEVEVIKDLPQNIQSEVVQKRPDILKAEADLQKSRIDVSLARKDFLPDFPIIGQFGFNANSFAKSFNWDSYIASIGGGLAQSVFTGGQRRARLKAKKAQYQEMLENYQKTILKSFQEVNDSLAAIKFDSKKNNDNIERIKLEKDNMEVIQNQYSLGSISLLDVLQYKERIYSLEKDQTQSKTDCLVDSLSLYKAVSGKL